MPHRVLHQRLQGQRRNADLQQGVVDLPLHSHALAETHRLDVEVAPRQIHFLLQRHQRARLAHAGAEQFGQIVEHGLGALGLLAHQGAGGVEGVEQKVRADARLQFTQPRLHVDRREGPCAQLQIVHKDQRQRRPRQRSLPGLLCSARRKRVEQGLHQQIQTQRRKGAQRHGHGQHRCCTPQPPKPLGHAHQRQPEQRGGLHPREQQQGADTAFPLRPLQQHEQRQKQIERHQRAHQTASAADVEAHCGFGGRGRFSSHLGHQAA